MPILGLAAFYQVHWLRATHLRRSVRVTGWRMCAPIASKAAYIRVVLLGLLLYQTDGLRTDSFLSEFENFRIRSRSSARPNEPKRSESKISFSTLHLSVSDFKCVLRGGSLAVDSSDTRQGSKKFFDAFKSAFWSCSVCFLGLVAISVSLFAYLSVVSQFLHFWSSSGVGPSMFTIAFLSVLGTMLSSSVGGAVIGRIASSHQAVHAGAAAVIFVILQLLHLSFFEGIPAWFAVVNLLPFAPCCVLAARLSAQRPPRREPVAAGAASEPTSTIPAPAAATATAEPPPSPADCPGPDSSVAIATPAPSSPPAAPPNKKK